MGCCISHDKPKTVEVILDKNGVAERVSDGKGTHYYTQGPEGITLTKKPLKKPSDLCSQRSLYKEKKPMIPSLKINSNTKVEPDSNNTANQDGLQTE
ncbi:hypothetical protein BD408DRAFT_428729 [Parasitella parasitica]|nr:hypothetical protein BD408DRAFT_428729 [Parasitella parasitica]